MYFDDFFTSLESTLHFIRTEQAANIKKAAGIVADSLAQQGLLAVMDTGHMLKYEALNRAGGLMAISPFDYELRVENDAIQRESARSAQEEAEIEARKVALALDASNMRAGDVLFINSNSGRTPNVIETAHRARERGIRTVGIASQQQMTHCEAAHPSGKKLFDVVEIAIDNGAPHGDAAVEVRDNEKMCPISGISAATVLWAIQAEAVELLQARGVNPSIYRSVHVSGFDYLNHQRETFQKRGY